MLLEKKKAGQKQRDLQYLMLSFGDTKLISHCFSTSERIHSPRFQKDTLSCPKLVNPLAPMRINSTDPLLSNCIHFQASNYQLTLIYLHSLSLSISISHTLWFKKNILGAFSTCKIRHIFSFTKKKKNK